MLIILVLIYCGFIFYKALGALQVSDGEISDGVLQPAWGNVKRVHLFCATDWQDDH